MNIELIGTGAMYTEYNGACTLIDEKLIVDMPNGTVKQLLKRNLNPGEIDTIVITHLHGDHTADLPFFLLYVFRNTKRKEKITVIGPKGLKKQIKKLYEAYLFEGIKLLDDKYLIQFIEINEEKEINIDNYKIEPHIVEHGNLKPCYGYVINEKLGFSGDCNLCKGIEEIASKCEILIADTSIIKGDRYHMGIDNVSYLINKYNIKVIPTHIRDITREEIKKANIDNLILKEDFDQISL